MTRGRRIAIAAVAAAYLALLALDDRDNPLSETPVADAMAYDAQARRIARAGVGAEPPFHQAPLFPVAASLAYGPDTPPGVPRSIAIVQLLGIAAVAAMMVPAGRLAFGSERAGWYAAALVLLCAPIPFHALKLLPVTLAAVTQVAALLASLELCARPTAARAVLAGAACGIAALARAEFLLFVPVVALVAAFARAPAGDARGTPRERAGRVAAALVAAGVVIAPATVHNAAEGDFVPIAYSGGENLFAGNRLDGDGGHTPIDPRAGDLLSSRELAVRIAEEAIGRPPAPSEVSSYWTARAWEEIRSDPGRFVALVGRKLMRAFDPGDPADLYSLPLEREWFLPTLYLAWVPVGAVFALAGIGVFFAVRARRWAAWLPVALVAVHLAVTVAFFTSARLRVPLVVACALLGGLAIERLAAGLRARSVTAWAAAVAVGAVATWSALATDAHDRDRVRLASVLSTRGELDAGVEVLRPATERDAPDAVALDQLGWLRQQQGRSEPAARAYRAAIDAGLPPGRSTSTLLRLAAVEEQLGDRDAAGAAYDRAVREAPGDAPPLFERARFLGRAGDLDGAARDLRRAVELAPGWSAPREALRRLETARARGTGSPAAQSAGADGSM